LLAAVPATLPDPLPVSWFCPVPAVPEPEPDEDGEPLLGGLAGAVVVGWPGVAVPIFTPTCCGDPVFEWGEAPAET
jgi:hypothetical protein